MSLSGVDLRSFREALRVLRGQPGDSEFIRFLDAVDEILMQRDDLLASCEALVRVLHADSGSSFAVANATAAIKKAKG